MASASGVRQRRKGTGYEQVSHDEDAFNKFFQQEETTTVLGVELTEDEAIMCKIGLGLIGLTMVIFGVVLASL